MNLGSIRQRADQLRAIPLPDVLRASGAQPDPHDKAKWHTLRGLLSVTGPKFINWNQGVGGGGAIDLIIHLHQLGFREALDWLGRHFPNIPAQSAPPRAQLKLQLPSPDPAQLGRVRHYLLVQRALPALLVDSLIQAGSIYADPRANAVFVLRSPDHTPVGAELRGTTAHAWRGMAPGSKKDLGFFSIPAGGAPAPTIILCESAIVCTVILLPENGAGKFHDRAGGRPNVSGMSVTGLAYNGALFVSSRPSSPALRGPTGHNPKRSWGRVHHGRTRRLLPLTERS
ncbi:MAG: DUF3991 domain-containing protein [Acidobacteria bacterium]|nr:DUF3991 domain-containing protein [Acidobacteriota bacterium]